MSTIVLNINNVIKIISIITFVLISHLGSVYANENYNDNHNQCSLIHHIENKDIDQDKLQSEEMGIELESIDDPEVGDRRDFKVMRFDGSQTGSGYDNVEFELRAISDKSEIWVEVDELEEGKINDQIVEDILRQQDEETPPNSIDSESGIIETSQRLFGDPPDIDGTGRLKTLLVNIQDGWEDNPMGGYISGFFNPADQNPSSSYGNNSDIIYINTYPGIYRDNREADASRIFNIIAHEYQHLIHHNYGNLNSFQNEGQSLLAEVLLGYSSRYMGWLDKTEELEATVEVETGPEGLYRFRRNSSDLSYDYQRAQLLHSYLYERTGAEAAASITRSSNDGKKAYLEALETADLSWDEFLLDFQITNKINDPDIAEGIYAYSLEQFENIGIRRNFSTHKKKDDKESQKIVNSGVNIGYGGSYYSNFSKESEYEEFEIVKEEDEKIKWAAVTSDEVIILDDGPNDFDEDIILVAANTTAENGDESKPSRLTYRYSYTFTENPPTPTYADGEDQQKPVEHELKGAYPNPFNPSTEIRYKLSEFTDVQISVYDINGRKIETLVDEAQQPGEYQARFEGGNLSSGVYIYRITTSDWSDVGRMTMVK